MVAPREQTLGLFLKSGFTASQAVLAWSTWARYVLGSVDDVSPALLGREFAFGLELPIEGLNHRVNEQDAG